MKSQIRKPIIFGTKIYTMILVFPTIAFWIVSYLTSFEYKNMICDNQTMKLPHWLFISNTFNIAYFSISGTTLFLLHSREKISYFKCFGILTLFYIVGIIVCNSFGIVYLYHFYIRCHNIGINLWTISIITVSFQFINIMMILTMLFCNWDLVKKLPDFENYDYGRYNIFDNNYVI